MAQGEIRPLMRAGPFRGEDPVAVLHEDEMTARDEDRDDLTAGESFDTADVDPAPAVSRRDRLGAHGGRR